MKKLFISLFTVLGLILSLATQTYANTVPTNSLEKSVTNPDRYYVKHTTTYLEAPFFLDLEANGLMGVTEFNFVIEDYYNQIVGQVVVTNYGNTIKKIFITSSDSEVEIEINNGDNYKFVDVSSLRDGWEPDLKVYITDIEMTFEDVLEPVINGETAFVTNIDNPITEAQIRSYLRAYDETDGDITHKIVLKSSTYDPVSPTIGSKTIVYSVTDNGGNESILTVTVLVKDVTAPTLTLSSWSQTISYTQTLDVETLKNSIQKSDNVDPSSSVVVTVTGNTYTANKSIPGTYKIMFEGRDLTGNKTNKEYTVMVIDDVKPIATYNATIIKPSTSSLTINNIMSEITATDVIDGNVTSSLMIVSDGFTGNGNKVGDYVIRFSVKDSSNNVLEFDVTVRVVDNIPPVFLLVPGYFIRVEDVVTLTLEDFIDILRNTGQLEMSGTMSYSALMNEYTGNENIPGTYAMSLRFVSTSGQEEVKSFAVQVIESEESDGTIEEEKDSLWVTIVDYIKDNPIQGSLYIIGVVLALIGLFVVIFMATSNQPRKHRTKYSKYIGKR